MKLFPCPAWCFQCRRFITEELQSPCQSLCLDCVGILPGIEQTYCLACCKQHPFEHCKTVWSDEIGHLRSLFWYQEPLNNWVTQLKYSRNFNAGRVLSELVRLWSLENESYFLKYDFLLTVPLHWRRFLKRGFNQTQYLLSAQNKLKPNTNLIQKIRHTPHQAGKSSREREINLHQSFAVTKKFKGERILLFDDVCTTGQTLKEISRNLMEAGASKIDALVLCKTRGERL